MARGNEEMLDTPAAARVLGLDERTLVVWRSRGVPDQPPFCRIGKAIRYRRRDLIEYIEQRRTVFAGEGQQ